MTTRTALPLLGARPHTSSRCVTIRHRGSVPVEHHRGEGAAEPLLGSHQALPGPRSPATLRSWPARPRRGRGEGHDSPRHPRGRWSRSGGDVVEAPLDDPRQEQAQGGAGHDGERQGGQHGPGQGRDRRATSLRVVDARCAAHGTHGVATHLGASRGQGRADLGRRSLRRLRRSGHPDSVVGWSERTAMGGSDPRDERSDPRAG